MFKSSITFLFYVLKIIQVDLYCLGVASKLSTAMVNQSRDKKNRQEFRLQQAVNKLVTKLNFEVTTGSQLVTKHNYHNSQSISETSRRPVAAIGFPKTGVPEQLQKEG